jgi:MarR family transcriptional regulator, 2-MHQ and catechol-resistance regulon repressor
MKIEEEIKAKFKSPQQKAIVNIRHTSNWMSGKQNAFMKKFDLSMPQFNILRILRGANETLSVNIIKQRMIEKSPNTTRLLDKLILKKLIERIKCNEDKRIIFVSITQQGLDLLKKIDENFDNSVLFSSKLSDEEANQLSDLLDKLRS